LARNEIDYGDARPNGMLNEIWWTGKNIGNPDEGWADHVGFWQQTPTMLDSYSNIQESIAGQMGMITVSRSSRTNEYIATAFNARKEYLQNGGSPPSNRLAEKKFGAISINDACYQGPKIATALNVLGGATVSEHDLEQCQLACSIADRIEHPSVFAGEEKCPRMYDGGVGRERVEYDQQGWCNNFNNGGRCQFQENSGVFGGGANTCNYLGYDFDKGSSSSGAQQCNSDGTWYNCNDPNCNLVRSCTGQGLNSCACPLNSP